MSHLADAMKKAAGTGARQPAPPAPDLDETTRVPTEEPTSSPWDFAETAAAPAPSTNRSAGSVPAPATTPAASPEDTVFALSRGFDQRLVEKLVVSNRLNPVSVEQYRRLAATLHHAQVDRGIKVVMVASAVADEGKTLTATNLALTLSESYRRRVLLIDADLRRPTLHAVFQVPNLSGLTDGLRSNEGRKFSILEISSHLSMLTAGRPDPEPMSALVSPRMNAAIQEAASKFDWVIIDTPPVGLMPDANLLAAMVDGAVLVVRAGQTPHAQIARAVESVGRERVLGIVLNCVTEGDFGHAYYHEYYKYEAR